MTRPMYATDAAPVAKESPSTAADRRHKVSKADRLAFVGMIAPAVAQVMRRQEQGLPYIHVGQ